MSITKRLTEFQGRFNPDVYGDNVLVHRLDVDDVDEEQPVHQHLKGQLLFVQKGGLICETPGTIWLIPPGCALWIPGKTPHRVRVKDGANSYYLFIKPDTSPLPHECRMFSISPLIRELFISLTGDRLTMSERSLQTRMGELLLALLPGAPVISLQIPITCHPIIRTLADTLIRDPGDRTTVALWAGKFGISERSLARLVMKETAFTFGRWRQQFQLFFALQQLKTGASVKSVATGLGYESTTAFITMFKKVFGHPPAHYLSSLR